MVQPLVENAVFYGLKETTEQVVVGLSLEEDGIYQQVTVTNPGAPLRKPFAELISSEHALGNISERLALLFDSNMTNMAYARITMPTPEEKVKFSVTFSLGQ